MTIEYEEYTSSLKREEKGVIESMQFASMHLHQEPFIMEGGAVYPQNIYSGGAGIT
jgi:hypothetical protein